MKWHIPDMPFGLPHWHAPCNRSARLFELEGRLFALVGFLRDSNVRGLSSLKSRALLDHCSIIARELREHCGLFEHCESIAQNTAILARAKKEKYACWSLYSGFCFVASCTAPRNTQGSRKFHPCLLRPLPAFA